MITITLDSNSGITAGELSVFPSKSHITGFVNVKTSGTSWYFSANWRYGTDTEYAESQRVIFDNLSTGIDVPILNELGEETYPTTDGGYTDFRKDIYRVCDRFKQILEEKYPSLVGQITITGIPSSYLP